MATYHIGQIVKTVEDQEVEGFLGNKRIIPKGSEAIIGADNLVYHMKRNCIQKLPEDAEVKGYDCEGLAKYIVNRLEATFGDELEEALEGSCILMSDFVNEIEFALDDIGFNEK